MPHLTPSQDSWCWGGRGTLGFQAELQGDVLAAVLGGSLGRLSTLLPVPWLTVDGGEQEGLQGKGTPTGEPNGHAPSLPQSQSSGLALVLSPNTLKPYTETPYKTRAIQRGRGEGPEPHHLLSFWAHTPGPYSISENI